MSYKLNNDNIYKEGSVVRAKSHPDQDLVITRYYHRTYYCTAVNDPTRQNLEYFEKDLIPPGRRGIKI